MTTKRMVQIRRRIRLFLGWALVLSVAVGELWMLGQFANGFSRSTTTLPGQAVPPLAETLIAIR
jgi:hypothetical protein